MRILTIFLLTTLATTALAQLPRYYEQQRSNEGGILPISISYGFHWPGNDLADRFGFHTSAGGTVEYLLPSDYIFGLQSHYIFGSEVEESTILDGMKNEDGLIFGIDGSIAEVKLRMRGLYVGGHIGKIFRLRESQRSGVRATLGVGFYQHKIRIQDDPVVTVPYLDQEYKKGYDRLSNGLAITQFVGYQHLGKRRRINFIIGLEFAQAFTENRRNFNFDTRSQESGRRLDLSYGMRMGWTLPLYIDEDSDALEY